MEEVRWLINSRAMYRMSNKVAGKDYHYWERQHDMDSSQVSFGLAFVAGLLSFLSPCMLPLVPIFLAQLVGQSAYQPTGGEEDRPRAVRHLAARNAVCARLYAYLCCSWSDGQYARKFSACVPVPTPPDRWHHTHHHRAAPGRCAQAPLAV